ncbi:MAG: putative inactive lipase [Mycobacterium sp.]|jgi:pimeloyl-ACP methyl ester carboxylesterase|nr:putative inactive lipase [Mycobacterium sp.]MDT5175839.1 hypothetical protein [Mycobacterium sp.]
MAKKLLAVMCAAIFALQIGLLVTVYPFTPLAVAALYDQFLSTVATPEPVAKAQLDASGPGSLVSATTMTGVTRTWNGMGLQAARVVYRSTSGDDMQPTVVSGSVFVPNGAAPDGGWPVVSFGHGTLGIDNPCAPSLSSTLLGSLKYVQVLVDMGYAVAVADYQGLGVKGVHPYTDSRTAGLNMIDAVRALRHTFPDVSDRWVAVGDSQGGGAAWAADEQAHTYAPELDLLGGWAASPSADVSGLVQKAQDGTLTPEQRPALQAAIESLARLHPDLARDDFRRGAAAHYWNVLTDCTPDVAYRRIAGVAALGPGDFAPHSSQAGDRLRGFLRAWALPQLPLSAPLYVWYGGKDPFIDAEWTKAAIARACAMGGTVTIEFAPNGGHNPPDAAQLVTWLADRFQGKPAVNDC